MTTSATTPITSNSENAISNMESPGAACQPPARSALLLVLDLALEHVRRSEEPRHELRLGALVDLLRRADLLDPALADLILNAVQARRQLGLDGPIDSLKAGLLPPGAAAAGEGGGG